MPRRRAAGDVAADDQPPRSLVRGDHQPHHGFAEAHVRDAERCADADLRRHLASFDGMRILVGRTIGLRFESRVESVDWKFAIEYESALLELRGAIRYKF